MSLKFEQKKAYYDKVKVSNFKASSRLERKERKLEISAKIIAHSKSTVNGKEIVTFELEYPRFIHSELLTHRLFSRNAASSRAIPVAKMIEQVRDYPATPTHWGKNQPGMQANEELTGLSLYFVQDHWFAAADAAATMANEMKVQGAHKQIVNRILEPYQWMKTVLTATEFDNFFWLRKHPDAQPEIKLLAEKMWEAFQESEPTTLYPGSWHVPYFSGEILEGAWVDGMESQSLEDALAISSSCCAQVSYRLLDDSLKKAKVIYKKLVESKPVHASPFEHQATPMRMVEWTHEAYTEACENGGDWEEGTTHCDVKGNLWSGNFKSFIQYRQLLPDNTCWNYEDSI